MKIPKEQMDKAQVAAAQAVSMERFYEIRPDLRCTANTYMIREWAAKNMPSPVLTDVAEIEWVVSQLDGSLAVISPETEYVEPEVAPPPPTFEERRGDYETKLKAADSTTHRKLALVSAMRSRGYTATQIAEGLQTHGFPPMTEAEWSLLDPPAPNENSGEKAAAEIDSAAAHIGKLLGRGPVSAKDIKALSADETRKLLWPGGRGTPMSRENERAIDIILRGGK
jgi:hypothetical protein